MSKPKISAIRSKYSSAARVILTQGTKKQIKLPKACSVLSHSGKNSLLSFFPSAKKIVSAARLHHPNVDVYSTALNETIPEDNSFETKKQKKTLKPNQ